MHALGIGPKTVMALRLILGGTAVAKGGDEVRIAPSEIGTFLWHGVYTGERAGKWRNSAVFKHFPLNASFSMKSGVMHIWTVMTPGL